jgi:hypothetical protein
MLNRAIWGTIPLWLILSTEAGGSETNFSDDILPILSDRCFHCHGPDEAQRKAGLRLDLRAGAIAERKGVVAIIPGNPGKSALMARVTSADPDELMPPPDSHRKPLTTVQVEKLRAWIAEGAVWGKHWAFEKPEAAPLPSGAAYSIDGFVREQLTAAHMVPAPEGPKHALVRRVYFDLTGLPPTPEEVAGFVADEAPDAWARLVKKLLESNHHGERMAMWWLDAARYADTDGYQGDANRTNWPWRDWVVQAFSDNMPFDQFTIEQFAGDLLPHATAEQELATCFHRNHMTNGEGGRLAEESRIDYVIDRVNTMGTVWLGLTLGCTQCHDHKFDPVSQKDYYSMFAFFNSIDENGSAGPGAKPHLSYQSKYAARAVEEARRFADSEIARERVARQKAIARFAEWLESQVVELDSIRGFQSWRRLAPEKMTTAQGTGLSIDEERIIQAGGENPFQDEYRIVAPVPDGMTRLTGAKLEVFPHEDHTGGKLSRGKSGEFILTNVKIQIRKDGVAQVNDLKVTGAVADVEGSGSGRNYGKVKDTLNDDPRNGWTTAGHDATKPHTAVFALEEPVALGQDEELVVIMTQRSTTGDANVGRFRLSVSDQAGKAVRSLGKAPLEQLVEADPKRSEDVAGELREELLEQFLVDDAEYQVAKDLRDRAKRQLNEVEGASGKLNVMVLGERKEPRESHILERGVWDKKGAVVERAVLPAVLPWPEGKAKTRIDLANWLVSPENPLTARVIVNHLWQMFFGAGLVRTPEDFGLQGERPTHPELLDWLAVEFMQSGWDLRHMITLLVSSETYRQDSSVTPESLERDPENRLLARGARYRLPAWMLRDAALKASGLINPALGGPPIRAYQPDGVWQEIFMGRFRYEPSVGSTQHRRTLYTFWRRSSAPTFLFDSAQRRVCEVSMRLTNTPLHALTLLNDVTQLEASRALAERAIASGGDAKDRLQFLFMQVTTRPPSPDELAILIGQFEAALNHYAAHAREAADLITVGQYRAGERTGKVDELAAFMVMASVMLNLDEAISRN